MPHVKGNKFKPKIESNAPTTSNEIEKRTASSSEKSSVRNTKRKHDKQLKTIVLPPPSKKASSTHTLLATATSNWAALQASQRSSNKKSRIAPSENKIVSSSSTAVASASRATQQSAVAVTRVLALDCEMVGTGPDGIQSSIARVSVVNSSGKVLFDSYVAPTQKITDFRTEFSGIRPHHLKGAPPFHTIQQHVSQLLQGRILVGHALHNDLDALGIQHPVDAIRDSSKYPPFQREGLDGRSRPSALQDLARVHLGLTIQDGEHNSVEDARAALSLYQRHKGAWEAWHAQAGKERKKHEKKKKGKKMKFP